MVSGGQQRRLNKVEHILGSGGGVLDFAIEGQNEYETWVGPEDADWIVDGVDSVENVEEDRFVMYPEGSYFVCEIDPEGSDDGQTVRCWSE